MGFLFVLGVLRYQERRVILRKETRDPVAVQIARLESYADRERRLGNEAKALEYEAMALEEESGLKFRLGNLRASVALLSEARKKRAGAHAPR
jgi:hypothetical protein